MSMVMEILVESNSTSVYILPGKVKPPKGHLVCHDKTVNFVYHNYNTM